MAKDDTPGGYKMAWGFSVPQITPTASGGRPKDALFLGLLKDYNSAKMRMLDLLYDENNTGSDNTEVVGGRG